MKSPFPPEPKAANLAAIPAPPAEDYITRSFVVPPECEGMRLDRFIQVVIPRLSRAKIQALIDGGAFVLSSGRRAKASAGVFGGEEIQLHQALTPQNVEQYQGEIPVLFEDRDLCVVNKPAPLACHPSARYRAGTVVDRLQLRLIHRLDRETSGVLLLAKTPEAERRYSEYFRTREMDKRYLAWVVGRLAPTEGVIDLPLRLAPNAKARVRMEVHPDGLAARTRYQVLSYWEDGVQTPATHDPQPGEEGDLLFPAERRSLAAVFTRVALYPETGRQHQLRVHLAALGHPIAGDKLYHLGEEFFLRDSDGVLTDEDRARNRWPRMLLHAEALTFPYRDGERTVHAPPPSVFESPLPLP